MIRTPLARFSLRLPLTAGAKEMDRPRSAVPRARASGGAGEFAEFGDPSEHFPIVWIRCDAKKGTEKGPE